MTTAQCIKCGQRGHKRTHCPNPPRRVLELPAPHPAPPPRPRYVQAGGAQLIAEIAELQEALRHG